MFPGLYGVQSNRNLNDSTSLVADAHLFYRDTVTLESQHALFRSAAVASSIPSRLLPIYLHVVEQPRTGCPAGRQLIPTDYTTAS